MKPVPHADKADLLAGWLLAEETLESFTFLTNVPSLAFWAAGVKPETRKELKHNVKQMTDGFIFVFKSTLFYLICE
jgi:hypothetical protein